MLLFCYESVIFYQLKDYTAVQQRNKFGDGDNYWIYHMESSPYNIIQSTLFFKAVQKILHFHIVLECYHVVSEPKRSKI